MVISGNALIVLVIFRGSTLVGHVPRELKDDFLDVIKRGGLVTATVTGRRGNTRRRGLEVPVTYEH